MKDLASDLTSNFNSIPSCAPLFIACKNGSAETVDYLVSICGAEIEQRGLYEVLFLIVFGLGCEIWLTPIPRSLSQTKVLEEGISHHVTPLWCAAVSGRLAVVKVHLMPCSYLGFVKNLCPNFAKFTQPHGATFMSRRVGMGCFTLEGSAAARRRRRCRLRLWLDADPVRLLHRAPRDEHGAL